MMMIKLTRIFDDGSIEKNIVNLDHVNLITSVEFRERHLLRLWFNNEDCYRDFNAVDMNGIPTMREVSPDSVLDMFFTFIRK